MVSRTVLAPNPDIEEMQEYEQFEEEFVTTLPISNQEDEEDEDEDEEEESEEEEEEIDKPSEEEAAPSQSSLTPRKTMKRRSFKEKLQQDGEVVLYKQLYSLMQRYEVATIDYANILANFINALTSGNYPPKRRRKLSEIDKLRLKIESLTSQEKEDLARSLNPLPDSGSVSLVVDPRTQELAAAAKMPF